MYDYVIVTHIPVFYKANLYNELAKKLNILVIFVASNTVEKRADDFVTLENVHFNYRLLYEGDFQRRDVKKNIIKLRKLIYSIEFKKLLVGGWDLIEFWYLVFANDKTKNCLALESTVFESTPKGIKGWLKRVFLSRISTVFASGNLHVELLKALNFKGDVKITRGVGITNKPNYEKVKKKYQKRFLYVGRLAQIKNLETIIKVFNELSDYYLTIVGDGEEKKYLQSIANQNITFKPPIENVKLQTEFLNHDIFILPSTSESWGLVVEEALYFSLPVMVSKNCGSAELVKNRINGYLFDPLNAEEIKQLILGINDAIYQKLIEGVGEFSVDEKDTRQVEAFV